MHIGLIDLDGSVVEQLPLLALVEAGQATRIEARDLAPRLRIVANPLVWDELFARVDAALARHQRNGSEVMFFGSGDFHHLSAGLIARHALPLTVIHFDQHPDWVGFPKTRNCGSWVNHALDLTQVDRVITLGPSGDDLNWPEWKSANLKAVETERLIVWPWQCKPSRVLGRYAPNQSFSQSGFSLHWQQMAQGTMSAHVEKLMPLIRTHAIYVSIDKDVLTPREAITNWDQGGMTLQDIETILARLAAHHQIVGIDVCGDYSEPVFSDWFRRLLSMTDRSNHVPPADHHKLNARTNAALLDCFRKMGL
jgi:arginase family enzyme